MARRRISHLLSFLSAGWVGTSLRSSAKAPFTFCWRHRSRVLVKTRRRDGWSEVGFRRRGGLGGSRVEEGSEVQGRGGSCLGVEKVKVEGQWGRKVVV